MQDFGDALALIGPIGVVALFVVLAYISSREKQRRLEMIHKERMAAIEKGVPLPELPNLDPPPPWMRPKTPPNPNASMIVGIVLLCAGLGIMMSLLLIPIEAVRVFWPIPMPLALVGLGLLLYHFLLRSPAE